MCLFSNGQTLAYTSLTAITNLLCIQSIIRHELFTERDAPIKTRRQKGKGKARRQKRKVSKIWRERVNERERQRENE